MVRFNAAEYLTKIERRLAKALGPTHDASDVARIPEFIPHNPETWPSNMELPEVAQVLRYQDQNSIWELTNIPMEEGGLRYLSLGSGKVRKRRLIAKSELLDFISRNQVGRSPKAIALPSSRKRRKNSVQTTSGGLMARATRKSG